MQNHPSCLKLPRAVIKSTDHQVSTTGGRSVLLHMYVCVCTPVHVMSGECIICSLEILWVSELTGLIIRFITGGYMC